jgi:hypothetical protein
VAEPISSTLKMEAISSSETSVETQRTTRRHISEHDTLQIHFVFEKIEEFLEKLSSCLFAIEMPAGVCILVDFVSPLVALLMFKSVGVACNTYRWDPCRIIITLPEEIPWEI